MKRSKHETNQSRAGARSLTSSNRDERCADSKSRELQDGKKELPGPRGACSKESRSQGSE
jgi:hypothetical protein